MATQQQYLKEFMDKQRTALPQVGAVSFPVDTNQTAAAVIAQEHTDIDPASPPLMPSLMPRSSDLGSSTGRSLSPDGSYSNHTRPGPSNQKPVRNREKKRARVTEQPEGVSKSQSPSSRILRPRRSNGHHAPGGRRRRIEA